MWLVSWLGPAANRLEAMASATAERPLVEQHGAVRIAVRVQPRAKRTEVRGVRDGELVVAVTAPPADGAANAALVKYLTQRLAVAKSRIELVRGSKGRSKILYIRGLTGAGLAARLGIAGLKQSQDCLSEEQAYGASGR